MITERQLRQIMPACENPALWVKHLNPMFKRYGFSLSQVARILAQIAVESGQLNHVEEKLRYTAKRILEVWPKRFPKGIRDAQTCAWNPVRLANRVYANRNGNGSEECGDGYRFRGRGLLQITGRENYKKIGALLDLDLVQFPDALLEPKHAAMAVGAYWTWRVKEEPGVIPTVAADTKAVTGGDIGLREREAFHAKAQKVLGDVPARSVGKARKARSSGEVRAPAVQKVANAASSEAWFE